MAVWAPRLAKVRVPGIGRGTGWAVGTSGVLVASSLVTEGSVCEVLLGAAPDRVFHCSVAWQSPAAPLALLQVDDGMRARWQAVLLHTAPALLAAPRQEATTDIALEGFGDDRGDTGASMSWMLAVPEVVRGTLAPQARTPGRYVLDLDPEGLSKTAVRGGLVGAVVTRSRPEPMVLGVAVARLRGRKRVRYEIAPLPEHVDGFAAALQAVGADPVVHGMDGPLLRRFLTGSSLDPAGRPIRVGSVTDPGWFGTVAARTDITPAATPHFPWVDRPELGELREALTAAVDGSGPPLVVLRGPVASGRSRLVAQALSTLAEVADFDLVAPLSSRSLLELPQRLRQRPCLVFLDGMDRLPSLALDRHRLRRFLAETPGWVFVGTVTGGDEEYDDGPGDTSPALAPAGLSGVDAVLADPQLCRTIEVLAEPVWQQRATAPTVAADSLRVARERGIGLGEYLTGSEELSDHYTTASWPARVLVDLVTDWDRTGVCEPLDLPTARLLWNRLVPTLLPGAELRAFERLTPRQVEGQWEAALTAATTPVLGSTALVRRSGAELTATDHARAAAAGRGISAAVWDHVIDERTTTPLQRLDIGIRALRTGTAQRALRAFESVLFFRPDGPVDLDHAPLVELVARRGIALYHRAMGRTEQAIWVCTDIVDTFDGVADPAQREQVALALLAIGELFVHLDSQGQAASAFGELVRRFGDDESLVLQEYVAGSLLAQAARWERLDRPADMKTVYTDIVKRYRGDGGSPVVREAVTVARDGLARLTRP